MINNMKQQKKNMFENVEQGSHISCLHLGICVVEKFLITCLNGRTMKET